MRRKRTIKISDPQDIDLAMSDTPFIGGGRTRDFLFIAPKNARSFRIYAHQKKNSPIEYSYSWETRENLEPSDRPDCKVCGHNHGYGCRCDCPAVPEEL